MSTKAITLPRPYKIGDQVWFFKNDSPDSELEVAKILDVSINGNVSVSRMKDGRSQYQRSTSFFFEKNDAIRFMVGTLLEQIDDLRTLLAKREQKVHDLDLERYSE
jgi:hypothetical protein